MDGESSTSSLPIEVFGTESVTLSAWFDYCGHKSLTLLRYEPETRKFWWFDPLPIAQEIIDGVTKVDPAVNIFRFERCRRRLLRMKLQLDGELKRKKVLDV